MAAVAYKRALPSAFEAVPSMARLKHVRDACHTLGSASRMRGLMMLFDK